MTYSEKKAPPTLSQFFHCVWTYETIEEIVENTILPDGSFDLILQLKKEKIISIKLTGLWTAPIDVKTEKNIKRLAVRFKPLAIEYLFDIDFRNLINTALILPQNFWDLDQLPNYTFETFYNHIIKQIEQIFASIKSIDQRKVKLFDLIFTKKPYTVKSLSEEVIWGSRQINRYFNNQFGLSLKMYLNIIRCHAAYDSLAQKNLVAPVTYFDQAHYIKEIKKFTGSSPKVISNNKNDRFIQLSTIK